MKSVGHGEPESCTFVVVEANAAQFPATGVPVVRAAGRALWPTVSAPLTLRLPYTVGLMLSEMPAVSGTLGLTGPWLNTASSTNIWFGFAAVFSRMKTRIDCATVVELEYALGTRNVIAKLRVGVQVLAVATPTVSGSSGSGAAPVLTRPVPAVVEAVNTQPDQDGFDVVDLLVASGTGPQVAEQAATGQIALVITHRDAP